MRNRVPSRWVLHIAVAVAYCAAYQLLQRISIPYWFLGAGLRISAVMLLGRRYWPALLIGDMAAMAPMAYDCWPKFGPAWSLVTLFPQVAFAMPFAWVFREWLPGPSTAKRGGSMTTLGMGLVLLASAGLSLLSAGLGTFKVTLIPPAPTTPPLGVVFETFTLGNFVGCLMVAPVALMIYEALRMRRTSLRRIVGQFARSDLLLESVLVGIVSVTLWLAFERLAEHEAARQMARLTAFIPVAWLALRHGWRGAGIGGVLASVGILLLMPPESYDAGTLQAQGFLVVVVASILLLGAKSDGLHRSDRKLARELRRAQYMARREVYAAELRMRRMSEILERSHGQLQLSHGRLLHRMRFVLTGSESAIYREELQAIRQQIYRAIDSIAPRDWPRHDLPGAIWNGPITQALEDIGVTYIVKDPQGPLSELSPDVRLTLFRLACESVAYLLAEGPIAAITLRLRGGRGHQGRAWAVLIVDGERDVEMVSALGIMPPTREQLREWLGASGLDLRGIRDRVSVYGGHVHATHRDTGGRVSLMLIDNAETRLDLAG